MDISLDALEITLGGRILTGYYDEQAVGELTPLEQLEKLRELEMPATVKTKTWTSNRTDTPPNDGGLSNRTKQTHTGLSNRTTGE